MADPPSLTWPLPSPPGAMLDWLYIVMVRALIGDCENASRKQRQESGLGQIADRVQSTMSTGPFPPGGRKGFDSSSPIQMEGSHRY